MPTPIPKTRLPGLKKALADFGEDEWASHQQLAELYGVTISRFTTLIKKRFTGFPGHERRGDKTHWYPARAAVAAMIRYMEDSERGKQVQARRHAAVMSGVEDTRAAAATEEPPLTAAEMDRLISAQVKAFNLARAKGEYVAVADMQRVTRGVFQLFARETSNMVNAIDPNGQLPAVQRKRLTDKCREILVKVHAELAAFLEDDDAQRASPAGLRVGNAVGVGRRRSPRGSGHMAGAA